MAISPWLMFWMLVASAVFGAAVGVLHSLHQWIRALLGLRNADRCSTRLYAVRLPILGRPLRLWRETWLLRAVRTAVVLWQDVVLFSVFGVGIAVILYYFNNGKFRLYPILSALLGFLVYSATLGKLLSALADGAAFVIRACFSILFALLLTPFRIFAVFFSRIAKIICVNIEKSIAKKRKRVYNKNKKTQLLRQATHGFLTKNG